MPRATRRSCHLTPQIAVLLALLALPALAGAKQRNGQLRLGHIASSFMRALRFDFKLRICNAYPYSKPLDIYVGKDKLTNDVPLAYKSCEEFRPELNIGDEVDFHVDGATAGSFRISELPQNDAVMLMVIYRHDVASTAVSFESHVFSNMMDAQIAVIDTYKGVAKSELRIEDRHGNGAGSPGGTNPERSEVLRYDSVVAVDPGIYEVVTVDPKSGQKHAKDQIVAVPRESYVVLRCGAEALETPAYPEELTVFPRSDASALGRAARAGSSPSLFVVSVGALLVAVGLRAA